MIDLFKRHKVKIEHSPENPILAAVNITVWGPPGAPGRTTIAANLACELALEGKRVLLIDLDTTAPSVALAFGLIDQPPGLAAACRLVGQGRLDHEQIDRLASKYEAGKGQLSILSGLSSAERWPEVSADKIQGILDIAKGFFDFIILDIAAALEPGIRQVGGVLDRNAAARMALSACDLAIAVVAADALGVQRFLAHKDSFKELAPNSLILVNRLRSSALGNGAKQQITDTLSRFAGEAVEAFIPNDVESCDQAALESVPLAMMKRSSPARQAIAQFVRVTILLEGNALSARVAKLI